MQNSASSTKQVKKSLIKSYTKNWMGSKKFLLRTVKLSEKLPYRSILKTLLRTCMGAMQTLLRTWSGRVPLSYENFCNIFQRAMCISCFSNFIAFGHAPFQADSGG